MKMTGSLENIQNFPYMGEDRTRICEEKFKEEVSALNTRSSLSQSQKCLQYRYSLTASQPTMKQPPGTDCSGGRGDNSKSFCFTCCLQLKRRTSCENSDNAHGGKSTELTAAEVLNWKQSFDKLISSHNGKTAFLEFLRTEYSEENLYFWLACEELRMLESASKEVVEDKARNIYEDYISILSPKEVSLDARVRDIIDENMIDPSPKAFDEAQTQIYTLMHRDSYPRFLNSPVYRKYLESVGEG